MPVSQTDIINLGLTNIGMETVSNPLENSTNGQKALNVWNIALSATLRAHPWNFATQNMKLAIIAGECVPGWQFLYQVPTNCLMVRRIFNPDTELTCGENSGGQAYNYPFSFPDQCVYPPNGYGAFPFGFNPYMAEILRFKEMQSPKSAQKCVASNLDCAWAEFTVMVTNTTLFDACFVDALAWRLSAYLAMPLTNKVEVMQAAEAGYKESIDEARRVNRSEGTEKAKQFSPTLASRG